MFRHRTAVPARLFRRKAPFRIDPVHTRRSEEHTSELQSPCNLVCRLLLEKKNKVRRPTDPLLSDIRLLRPQSSLAVGRHVASRALRSLGYVLTDLLIHRTYKALLA